MHERYCAKSMSSGRFGLGVPDWRFRVTALLAVYFLTLPLFTEKMLLEVCDSFPVLLAKGIGLGMLGLVAADCLIACARFLISTRKSSKPLLAAEGRKLPGSRRAPGATTYATFSDAALQRVLLRIVILDVILLAIGLVSLILA